MNKYKNLFSAFFAVLILFSFASCTKADKNYGVTDEKNSSVNQKVENAQESENQPIMSSDRVMSKYFDISLFDEENYADIYLGNKFEVQSVFAGDIINVPSKIDDLQNMGWNFAEGNTYNDKSLIFSYETVEVNFINEKGTSIKGWFYNDSRSSKQLGECDVVKFRIVNDFYSNPQNYNMFNVNGIKNSMAITDIIDTLGTPSHFYRVSDTNYYLDYFITKKDRRNRITVYINPVEDCITAIEFSSYK